MINILLNDHKVNKWININNNYLRGYFFDNDEYINSKNVNSFILKVNENNIEEHIKNINGNYSFIYQNNDMVFVAVDRIRSYPLFYFSYNNEIYISDSAEKLRDMFCINTVEEENLQELVATGFVTGRKTIYNNIFQVEAGQYLKIGKKTLTIQRVNYYLHKHTEKSNMSSEEMCKKLEKVVDRVFYRLIKSVNNKPIVLFLSGGYDSRLIAVNLCKHGYKDVYCISFGDENDKEVIAAKDVANSLNLNWSVLEIKNEYFKELIKQDEFKKFSIMAGDGVCIPYYQGVLAQEYIKQGLIPKNCVIITGNSGDVVEGNHFSKNFNIGSIYNKNDILYEILENHYCLNGKKYSQKHTFKKFVNELIPDKAQYTYEDCQDILEFFNWRERQSKYVVNDVRCYDDYLGVEWRLPLWDNEFVEFWLDIPAEWRCNRKLYYKYVQNEEYKTANEITMQRKLINILKRKLMFLIKILYPFKKVSAYFNDSSPFYSVDFLGYVKILFKTKGYKTSTITTNVYYNLKNYYSYLNFDFKKIVK